MGLSLLSRCLGGFFFQIFLILYRMNVWRMMPGVEFQDKERDCLMAITIPTLPEANLTQPHLQHSAPWNLLWVLGWLTGNGILYDWFKPNIQQDKMSAAWWSPNSIWWERQTSTITKTFYIARRIPEENWSKKSVKTQYQAQYKSNWH